MRTLPLARALGAGLLVLVVAPGCSGGSVDPDPSGATPSAGSSPTSSAGSAALSATDVAFVTTVRTLGEQGLRLSREADGSASDPQVTTMARGLSEAQQGDLATLADHGSMTMMDGQTDGDDDMPMMGDGSDGSDGSDGTGPMMDEQRMDERMDELGGLQGGPFDERFLALMEENHRAVLAACEDEAAHGSDGATRDLAGAMARGSRERLAQMQDLMASMVR